MADQDQVKFRDPLENAGFVALPNLVMLDPKLSDGAKITYSLLLFYARQDESCFPGQARLAMARGDVSDRTIRNHLNELEARKLIQIEQRSKGETNLYWIERLSLAYTPGDATAFVASTRRNFFSGLTGNNLPVAQEKDFRSPQEKDFRLSTSSTTHTSEVDTDSAESGQPGAAPQPAGPVSGTDTSEGSTPSAGNSSTNPPDAGAIDCTNPSLAQPPGKWTDQEREQLDNLIARHEAVFGLDPNVAKNVSIKEMRGAHCPHHPPYHKKSKKNPDVKRLYDEFWKQVLAKCPDVVQPLKMDAQTGGMLNHLLTEYDPALVVSMLRLAVWDWEAIKSERWEVRESGRIPEFRFILRIRQWLVDHIRTGVTSHQHRFTYYYDKFVRGTNLEDKRTMGDVFDDGRPSAEEARKMVLPKSKGPVVQDLYDD